MRGTVTKMKIYILFKTTVWVENWRTHPSGRFKEITEQLKYPPLHKTLQRTSAFVYWISVRFYKTDCSQKSPSLNTKKTITYRRPAEYLHSCPKLGQLPLLKRHK